MLFNSYEFLFAYLPIVLAGFFLIARLGPVAGAAFLALASLFFYGWWKPAFTALLLASVVFNYGAGWTIARSAGRARKIALTIGVAADLCVLGLFKYANFFIEAADNAGASFSLPNLMLPLGISFFTFTQIAFLVDVSRGITREFNFVHYLLFVTWFPHLIAGPVIHHKQIMPQFARAETYRFDAESMSVGLTMLSIGLFKKVVLADHLSPFANGVFRYAEAGAQPLLLTAWAGALAYALQIYFDFSGYSDMAIGLSRMFNVRLPLNFDSPYRSASIIDFWRRWHMTLSAFLRMYLYFPLGGNRKGPTRRYVNLMVTMALGGLWHGAGWNFILWGLLHGFYLMVNHGWRSLTGRLVLPRGKLTSAAAIGITFLAVVIAWVPFRAPSLAVTQRIWQGMVGLNGVSLRVEDVFPQMELSVLVCIRWIAIGLAIVYLLPNSQQWLAAYRPAWDHVKPSEQFRWRPSAAMGIGIGLTFAVSVLMFKKISPFLYFQF